jgi:hypothetical protein
MTATPTIHLAVVRLMRRIVGGDSVPWSIARDDPDLRKSALTIINTAWCALAFVCLVAMLVVGIPVRALAGADAGRVVVGIFVGAGFFCLAGCAHVLRRWYWYLPKARRRLRAGDRPAYEEAMRRTLLRNSSIVFQSVVGAPDDPHRALVGSLTAARPRTVLIGHPEHEEPTRRSTAMTPATARPCATDARSPMTGKPTIHLAVVRLMRPIVGGQSIVSMIASDDPDLRRGALTIINTAWCVLAFAFLVAMAVIGIPVQVLAGDRTGKVVIGVLAGASFFCLAGCAHVLRRWYWFLPMARRRLRAGDRPAYEEATRRSLPRNSSVVLQSVVGILTVLIALSSGSLTVAWPAL